MRFVTIFRWLVRPPTIYGMLYFSLIPIFGALFTVAEPQGFYAPYAKLEPAATEDRRQLAGALNAALTRSVSSAIPDEFVVGNWQLTLTQLNVDNLLSSDGSQLSFRIWLASDGIDADKGSRQFAWAATVSVDKTPTYVRLFPLEVNRIVSIDYSKYSSPFSSFNEDIVSSIFRPVALGKGIFGRALSLNEEEDQKFERFLSGIAGDASAVSGNFWRMVYLSVVVVTTLGLGDIVPVTPTARFLVGMEAVLGVFLAGLFLNSAAGSTPRKP